METLGKFLAFFGKLLALNWESYFKGSGQFFGRVAEAPGSSIFEALFCLFLLGSLATVLVGIGWSLVRLSPAPYITAVDWYTRLFGYIGAFIILILVVAMVYEVLARYFFSAPTKWAFEMAYMLMGTSFMFGIAYCMQMGRHIRVDFVYDHLSLKKRQVIDLAGYSVPRADAALADVGGVGVLRRCVPRGRDLRRVGLESDHLAVQVQPRRRHGAAVPADHRAGGAGDHGSGRPAGRRSRRRWRA